MDKRILDLTTISSVSSDDYLVVDGSSGTRKITPENIVENSAVAQRLGGQIDDTNDEIGEIQSAIGSLQRAIETIYPVDPTFTQSGKAADAKATGDKIDELKNDFSDISGSTRNLFSGDYIVGFINGSTSKLATTANGVVVYIPCTGGKTYTVSKTAGARFAVATTTSLPAVGDSVSDYSANNTASSITITASSSAQYLVAWIWLGIADTTITKEQMLASVQIEEGSVATDYIQHLTAIDLIARQNADLSVVADSSDLAKTYTPYVMVMNNDSAYGDGGACLFSVREGESVSGYTRTDGSIVYPMANQGVLPSSNAPKRELTEIIKSYVGVSTLQYGNTETMYDSTCSNQIDCSTFVTAIMNRIAYANSRYVLGTSASNKVGIFVGDTLLNYSSSLGWIRLLTHQMAQWFAEHKRLFEIPSNPKKACSILQFGDILFSGNGNHEENYYGIDHCLFVLGTNPDSGVVMVAQGGTAGSPTYYDNESTVCKTSVVYLTSQYVGNNYKVFARPNYGNSEIKSDNTLMRFAMDQVYQFEPFLLTNFYITATDGSISYAKTYAGTPDLYEVIPQKTIKYTGPAQSNGVNYTAYCIEYDENKNFVKYRNLTNGDDVLGATTKYVRFSFGHAASLNTNMTLAKLSDFKATMS